VKKRLYAMGLMFLIATNVGDTLFACGEKFLFPMSGPRYLKPLASRFVNSTILIWTNPESELLKGLAGVKVQEVLTKEGYRPTTVATGADFDKALSSGKWDLVLVGHADAQAVSGRLHNSATIVLPIILNPTKERMKQVQMEYSVVLKAPAKTQSLVDAVYEALKLKKSAAKSV
jgi:hypothetical protein